MSNVLLALINASERAANVARACCKGSSEEGALLVAEKCGDQANARFDHDFKTIADVLAQESAKAEIALRCRDLKYVRGEECAEIGGVQISLKGTVEETAELLSSLVPPAAAVRMAAAAHSKPQLPLCDELPDVPDIDPADLGVWIDPIDATSEFISGARGEAKPGHGLPCVTVLVGAYLRSTGEPVVGVINQPFVNGVQSHIVWGVSHNTTQKWGGSDIDVTLGPKTVLMSAAEKPAMIKTFQDSGWDVKSEPGAGYKLLKVALGEAAVYIVSQGTTFRWDTCAPHAILRAKGGELLNYSTKEPVTYNDPMGLDAQQYCNTGGIVAYNGSSALSAVKNILKW